MRKWKNKGQSSKSTICPTNTVLAGSVRAEMWKQKSSQRPSQQAKWDAKRALRAGLVDIPDWTSQTAKPISLV